jgi:hypothetical protein
MAEWDRIGKVPPVHGELAILGHLRATFEPAQAGYTLIRRLEQSASAPGPPKEASVPVPCIPLRERLAGHRDQVVTLLPF